MKRQDDGKGLDVHEAEVVAINSERASEVEFKHRDAGNRTLEVALRILEEVDANAAGNDGNVNVAALTLAGKAKVLKDLAYAIEKAVSMERRSWNMDKAEQGPGGATGIIQVNINVPEPKPLPERFR